MKERIRKLRERVTSSSCSLCIERAKFYTQAMRERGDEPIICRRAKALANILRNMKVQIFPDELIVGTFVSKPPGAIFYPELIGLLVMPEIDQIRDRKVNPLLISDDEIVILKKEIAPYWKSRTISDKARSYFSNEVKRVIPTLSPFLLTEANGISHTTPNYPFLIKKGFKEIGEIASKKEDDFFKAVEIVCQALCEFSNRYAAEAERMADEEKNDKRKEELVRISKICRQVPAYPPRDFQEALQFVWFTQLALYQENVDVGISIGRVDQFLLPFFRKDVEKIGEEGIKELIQCFWVKINELVNFRH
jgi:formate C-acetyltransferase